MALKAEVSVWAEALDAFDQQDFRSARYTFTQIATSAKIHFNIAQAFFNEERPHDAISALTRAIGCDGFLAVAYFQRGAALYNLNNLEDSIVDLDAALIRFRGNPYIDYTQLGLNYKLYACEVHFNRGLAWAAVGDWYRARQDLETAMREKPDDEEFRIMDEAIKLGDRAPEFLPPFEVPRDLVYRPPDGKMKNSQKKDFLGTAKVVASIEATDTFAGFSGKQLKMNTLNRTKSEPEVIGRSATLTRGGTLTRGNTVDNAGYGSLQRPRRDDNISPLSSNTSNAGRPAIYPNVPLPPRTSSTGDSLDARSDGSWSSLDQQLKVKCHFTDTRMMLVPGTVTFNELQQRIHRKFKEDRRLKLKYKDEGDGFVLMTDDEDLDIALAFAKIQRDALNSSDRLELWVALE
ncbi:hypothetical protein HDV00_003815 [Rhizophlyctis rosea]|nr:hypothetical protein HDV00_003815 [Rhizophlyctis rosea]